MRHISFTETTPSIPGMHDFSIDVERSGLPVTLEYKDALKQWQEEHQGGARGQRPTRASGTRRRAQTLVAQ